jgi:hypothetical protein
LETENRKLNLSFQAGNNYQKKIKKIYFYFYFYFFCVRADSRGEGGRGGREREEGEGREKGGRCVRADAFFTASADGKNPSAG